MRSLTIFAASLAIAARRRIWLKTRAAEAEFLRR